MTQIANDSLSIKNWEDAGYRFSQISGRTKEFTKGADALLQKLVSDQHGKKYFINVYVYFTPAQFTYKFAPVTYAAMVQLSLEGMSPFFNIEMNNIEKIQELEAYFEKFWEVLGKPYYEEFY